MGLFTLHKYSVCLLGYLKSKFEPESRLSIPEFSGSYRNYFSTLQISFLHFCINILYLKEKLPKKSLYLTRILE